jgi:hypothetical protein
MVGLIASQLALFAAAALIGFAAGFALRSAVMGVYQRRVAQDAQALRRYVNEARVRRARAL